MEKLLSGLCIVSVVIIGIAMTNLKSQNSGKVFEDEGFATIIGLNINDIEYNEEVDYTNIDTLIADTMSGNYLTNFDYIVSKAKVIDCSINNNSLGLFGSYTIYETVINVEGTNVALRGKDIYYSNIDKVDSDVDVVLIYNEETGDVVAAKDLASIVN